ncbi:putative glutamine amidotransferase-like protein C13C5.04 [Daldinia childiae]|uniref:putative glutamine amidotransferase-like protein C13C5.04 n=1 Tax=Daldinia childiae TaxID=326645 RepID=UPI001446DF01|nr:putative glutamine amidotransferase-like protein C13C5.04 [Daldinia childiae]KAF3062227.1 putative glutamine amidotransferase-like protein C13C5.04 [Daldinia childiae]
MGSVYIPPIRLAILEADNPVPGIKAKYGSYGGVFKYLFQRACASLEPPQPLSAILELSSHDIVNHPDSYPDPETIDAILISGSKYSAYDNDDWIVRLTQYTRRCLEGGRVRVIGVCFGHQIVGRALGVEVGKNVRGWEISVTDHDLTEEGKKLFGVQKLAIHQMHRDQVFSLPPGAIQLARTDVCDVQAMYIPKRFITVQGHPEFTDDMVREILEMRRYGGILGPDIFEDGMRRVSNKHDGIAVARAFLRFLRQ